FLLCHRMFPRAPVLRARLRRLARSSWQLQKRNAAVSSPEQHTLAGKLLQNGLIHPDSGVEIFERKILIRRMGAAIGQRQIEEQRFSAQNVSKIRNDRNAPALPNQRRVFVECFLERVLRGFSEFAVWIGEIPRTG